MLLAKVLIFGADILQTIQNYVTQYKDIAINFLNSMNVWIQAAILVGLALFAIIGLFVFIKKFFKLFIVLGILGAVGWYLYTQTDIITNLLDGVTGAIPIFLLAL
ncbi:MAG: hypothetical protein WC296_03630 [Candidatus Izemoplasmatales bacterium]|jgi:hypothetical protein|nr:hypothetical protein [Candidatus Izemoplasmatales bacterium]MDD4595710.1 hypothetical protein [Candidatus Izemoplasmatales bacterium]